MTVKEAQVDEAVAVPEEAVRAELDRILASRHFRLSKRSSQFLRYVVEQKLNGNERLIKERLIGIDIFGRKASYATGDDPVVRVQAKEVRKRLELYMAEAANSSDVAIELPIGNYVPIFRSRSAAEATSRFASYPLDDSGGPSFDPGYETELIGRGRLEETSTKTPGLKPPDTVPSPAAFDQGRLLPWLLALVLLALGIGTYLLVHGSGRDNRALRAFWAPMSESAKPMIISLGSPVMYVPGERMYDLYMKEHPEEFQGAFERYSRPLPLAPDTPMHWSDLRQMSNAGPAVGGVRAAMQLSALFGKMAKPFVVRFGSEGSFLELRDSPAVIVGALNTRWTDDLDRNLHFSMHDESTDRYLLEAGTNRTWKSHRTAGGSVDYGLITRQVAGPTGQFLIKVAGVGDTGTEAATELITSAVSLAAAVRLLPHGWERENVQLVVEFDVIGGKAGPPKVVSTFTW